MVSLIVLFDLTVSINSLYASVCLICGISSEEISIVLDFLGTFTSVALIISVPQYNDKTRGTYLYP